MRRLACLCLLLGSCAPARFDLVVDLNTDLRPRLDFERVRTTVLDAPSRPSIGAADDFVPAADDDLLTFPGHQVAELVDLPRGVYVVEVRLLDREGASVASRELRVDLRESRVIHVRITSDCLGVTCPGPGDPAERTECLGGRCVPPGCTADDPELCGTPGCTDDAQCSAAVPCARSACVAGECLSRADDTRCASDEYCDISNGCRERPTVSVDAGTDAGTDAGPGCDPTLCDDHDPCTIDSCVAGRCASTPRCSGSRYCRGGRCEPRPTFRLEMAEPGGCTDLGVDHASGSDFIFRRTIRGRALARSQQYNRHVGCGTPAEPAEVTDLDASGMSQDVFYGHALSECWDGIYGRWNAWVEIDGQRSNVEDVVYYNSTCPQVSTCALARSFCSPCRDCDLSRGYCYAGTTCAPDPTLSIGTPEPGGCVDLGVPHRSPPALDVQITGRPSSTATQMNEHVSCGLPEVAGNVRTLDASGMVRDPFATRAIGCVDGVYGRWDVTVEIDGQRSNRVSVTYYNSGCPGFDTCALARTYCPPGA